jgi:hypothetical protein
VSIPAKDIGVRPKRSPQTRRSLPLLLGIGAVVGLIVLTQPAAATPTSALDVANGHAALANGKLVSHPSGGAEVTYDERAVAADVLAGSDTPPDATAGSLGCANRGSLTNPRVNQDCTLRRQAEEKVVVNPLDANNVVAGQNDSRIGFNKCGFDYSLDGGKTWGDGLPPFFQHLSPIGHTYDAASDPAVAVDGSGRAWFSCVAFDVNSVANALFVVPSTPAIKGSAYANIGAGPSPFVVAEDASGNHLFDKEFIAADTRAGNGTVYITYTDFQVDPRCKRPTNRGGLCQSPIFISQWTGKGFTAPLEISGSGSFCSLGDSFNPQFAANACNFDQGSFPVVLPNGDVYVTFSNFNTPTLVNQQLGVRVHVNGNNLTADPPVKVGVDDETNVALCDFGRGPEECVQSINVRTNDFPALALDPTNGSHLVAVWQDTRAAASTGNYDLVVSESADGGATWSDRAGGGTVLTTSGAYFESSIAVTAPSHKIAVSTYRANQPTTHTAGDGTYGYGFLAKTDGGFGTYTPASDSQSLPSPQTNLSQRGFLGDYSSIAAAPSGDVVVMVWSDTRNKSASGVPDEDIFVFKTTI